MGPLGWFWKPAEICPDPTLAQIPFFAVVAIAEAISFGIGFAFLGFGYHRVTKLFRQPLATWVWISMSWLFINWFPHDSLHEHIGTDLWHMIAVDMGFHVTLIIATCIVAYAILTGANRAGNQQS